MSNKTYGYRRITMNLNRYTGSNHSYNYIYRLMRAYNIRSIIRRKKPGYIKSSPDYVADNILARDFSASKPNQKWLSDVTEFKANNGQKVYLCAIMDLYDNSIVSYNINNSSNNYQLFKTFNKAIELNPNAKPIFHSDRGYQYTSKRFKKMLDKQEITHSMSRVGKCIDNGPIENLWGIIKTEMFYIKNFNNAKEIEIAIDDYIEFYNKVRLQSKLKSHTPIEYRNMAI
jgi:putative transposase